VSYYGVNSLIQTPSPASVTQEKKSTFTVRFCSKKRQKMRECYYLDPTLLIVKVIFGLLSLFSAQF
jgi:hypothetical protein